MVVTTVNNGEISLTDDDIPYEEEILRNPFSVKHWLRYIEYKKEAPSVSLNILYERALKELPGSYKIWYKYLKLRRRQVENKWMLDVAYEDVNSAFERSLVFMHKMPRIWIDYCEFLVLQRQTTRTRNVFDRALQALPITQHHRIWPLYIKFVTERDIPETAVRVYRRYLKLCPEETEDYIEYLIKEDRLDEAAVKLAEIVNKDSFCSKHGKPKHQLWNELCELISKNPDQVHSVNADAIIRDGIRRFTDQIGHFWNSLADYYIRSSLFERARDIYEEAIQTVMTVRDFTQVFDAYAQFEEGLISAKSDELMNGGGTDDDDLDVDLRLARYEDLMDRRALLLNSVILRQNPHNVHEWHKRVKLLEGNPKEIIYTYTEAVQTVEPKLAVGKLNSLWVEFAKFYESNKQLNDARVIFGKAIQVPYTKVDDLATVWCEWAEMEIRHSHIDAALKLMHRATAAPPQKVDFFDQTLPVQDRLYKSLKIWSLYADLEESCGTFKSAKAVYDGIIDLKIATPQIIINYGLFLEENNYFEEAFKAYEKGIALFKWPNVYDIWNTYLTKFLNRYGGKKLERARDLFEQCLERCPPKFAKILYLLYAKLEEDHGLARHAMSIFERATRAVVPEEQFEMFNVYIRKAAEIYGVTYTRPIYEQAIDVLTDNEARQMCLKFADLERKLGEIDRARAVYAHCSQMCDPRTTSEFWQTWKEFEIRHGNVDTMKEMLRIKRSVQATYNTQVNFMSAQMLNAAVAAAGGDQPQDSMRQLEERAKEMAMEAMKDQPKVPTNKNISFVKGDSSPNTIQQENTKQYVNPDQIDLAGLCDASDDDDDDDDNDVEVEEQAIPEEVFSGLEKTITNE